MCSANQIGSQKGTLDALLAYLRTAKPIDNERFRQNLASRHLGDDVLSLLSSPRNAPNPRRSGSTKAHRNSPGRNCSSNSPRAAEERCEPCHPRLSRLRARHPNPREAPKGRAPHGPACTAPATPSSVGSALQPNPCL